MKQLSLVACYGPKFPEFAELLQRCIELVRQSPLDPYFHPYALEQIHGTLVGMERATGHAGFVNANLLARTGDAIEMNFSGLTTTLAAHLPLAIRFGGFAADARPFLSAGHSPYSRAFSLQWSTGCCTLIGWPHRDGDFTTRRVLNAIRDDLERACGLAHKYPEDNDFFLVLGRLQLPESLAGAELTRLQGAGAVVEAHVRAMLSSRPVDLVLGLDDLRIVAYEDVTLCPGSTASHELRTADLNEEAIRRLYG